jgi:hypothetical protein
MFAVLFCILNRGPDRFGLAEASSLEINPPKPPKAKPPPPPFPEPICALAPTTSSPLAR